MIPTSSGRKSELLEDAVRKSLAEVYEEEFKAKAGADAVTIFPLFLNYKINIFKDVKQTEIDEEDLKIKNQMDNLFEKVDALFHYQYAPPPVRIYFLSFCI